MKFPKTLFLTREECNDEPYFLTHVGLAEVEDDAQVAVYELVATRKMKVTRELED